MFKALMLIYFFFFSTFAIKGYGTNVFRFLQVEQTLHRLQYLQRKDKRHILTLTPFQKGFYTPYIGGASSNSTSAWNFPSSYFPWW